MEDKKLNKKIDRIILDPETMTALNDMIHQVQNELGDLVHLNTKIIANFILQKRCALLSKEELIHLKNENHDIIKALKKATQEAIRSRQNGCELNYEDIQKILQTPSVNEKLRPLEPRQRKKKSNGLDPKNNDLKILTELDTESTI